MENTLTSLANCSTSFQKSSFFFVNIAECDESSSFQIPWHFYDDYQVDELNFFIATCLFFILYKTAFIVSIFFKVNLMLLFLLQINSSLKLSSIFVALLFVFVFPYLPDKLLNEWTNSETNEPVTHWNLTIQMSSAAKEYFLCLVLALLFWFCCIHIA